MKVLIVPYGIETLEPVADGISKVCFNRTLWN